MPDSLLFILAVSYTALLPVVGFLSMIIHFPFIIFSLKCPNWNKFMLTLQLQQLFVSKTHYSAGNLRDILLEHLLFLLFTNNRRTLLYSQDDNALFASTAVYAISFFSLHTYSTLHQVKSILFIYSDFIIITITFNFERPIRYVPLHRTISNDLHDNIKRQNWMS